MVPVTIFFFSDSVVVVLVPCFKAISASDVPYLTIVTFFIDDTTVAADFSFV